MTTHSTDPNDDFSADTLDRAIVEYLEACEAGEPPNREEFLGKYASVADRLCGFLDNRQELDRMIKPIRQFQELVDPAPHEQEFGNYTLIREIGRGGMGVIYEARQQNLKRHVALKMIASHELRSENARRRFQVEAEAASTLEHPNIVRIYDVGQVDDRPFFTMKLIGGGSLKETLENGPLDPRVAAELAYSIARAVNYAHQRGILHRDLKPGNILMDTRPEDANESEVDDRTQSRDAVASSSSSVSRTSQDFIPMISDFGLAKRLDEDGGMTLTGAVLGTPSFMSPEQASGGNQIITTATDTYGVGAILYNMLTGEPPFVGDSPLEITRNVVEQPPSRIRQSNSAVDLDLETICLKCLEKRPQHRYETAGALADDLKRYLNGKPILARRSGAFEQVMKWARRNKAVAGMLSAIVSLLVVGLVGSLLFSMQLSKQRDQAVRRLFESKSAEVAARRASGEAGQRFKALAAAKEAVGQLGLIDATEEELFVLRSETAGSLALADIEEVARWTAPTIGSYRYQFSPDLKLFITQRKDGEPIEVYESERLMETKSVENTTPSFVIDVGNGNTSALAFSPCGRFAYVHTHVPQKSFVFDTVSKKVVFDAPTEHPGCLGERDGKPILIMNKERGFHVLELPSLEQVNELPVPAHSRRIRVSGDGVQLACIGGGQITVLSTRTGSVTWQQNLPFKSVDDFTWHPSEPIVAIPNLTELQLWRVGENAPWKTLKGAHYNRIFRPRFSADGTIVATSSWGNQSRFWDVATAEPIFSTAGVVNCFSQDGYRVAIGSSQVGVWDFDAGGIRRTIAEPEPPNTGAISNDLAIHPNNRWVALAQENGVRLFDLETSESLATLPSGMVETVRFHPDGTKMYVAGLRLLEWPIEETELGDDQKRLKIGPPREIQFHEQRSRPQCSLDIDPSGNWLAINSGTTSLIPVKASGNTPNDGPRRIQTHPLSIDVSVAANARLLAVGNHHGTGAQVFDGQTGELIKEIETPTHTRVRLSPAGDRLAVVHNGNAQLYETSNWKSIGAWYSSEYEFGWPMSFSPDGRYLLLSLSEPSGTLIVDASSGKQLIRIPGRTGSTPRDTPPCLTTDGRLVMITQGNGLEVWDINRVRRHLREIGLDWSDDSIAPERARTRIKPPVVEVDWGSERASHYNALLSSLRGRWSDQTARESLDVLIKQSPNESTLWHLRGQMNERRRRWADALADFSESTRLGGPSHESVAWIQRRQGRRLEAIENLRQATRGSSGTAIAKQLLAWELCLQPERMTDPNKAVTLAKQALEAYPQDIFTRKVLGGALLRANRLQDAIKTLREVAPSVSGRNVANAYGSDFLLALAYAAQGDTEEARRCFEAEIDSASKIVEISSSRVKDWMILKNECEATIDLEFDREPSEDDAVWFDAADLVANARATQGVIRTQHHHSRRRQGKADASQPAVLKHIRPRNTRDSFNLFWHNNTIGGELDVEFSLPRAGVCELKIAMVTARDYGIVEFEINGKKVARAFDGYTQDVFYGAAIVVDKLPLRKGKNVLTLSNQGKFQRSASYFAGIDSLQVTFAEEPTPK